MRPIDAHKLTDHLQMVQKRDGLWGIIDSTIMKVVDRFIREEPTIDLYPRWVRTRDELPKLPDKDYCSVWCITYVPKWDAVIPLQYERVLSRKNVRTERWKYSDRIAPWEPSKWCYLPDPPKEDA